MRCSKARIPELKSEWSERADRVLPSGITHDVRWRSPSGPYFTHGEGALKWDQDGRRYVDYVQGHGALLLGIAHPAVTAAVISAVQKGTHLGGNHAAEVEWAELIVEMVPCAEKVRFTSSGTEASLLSLRLARAATGRELIGKLPGHFHGWHDYGTVGINPPFDQPVSPGVPKAVLDSVVVLPEDPAQLVPRISKGDLAAVILEPSGASWGTVPLDVDTIHEIAKACESSGTLLIFDEVITGFRASRGGAQAAFGLVPDLCLLGKVVAGGMPGAAVAGRADLLAILEHHPEDAAWQRFKHVYHPGTFNANPASAAAGVACLKEVRDGDAVARAELNAAKLRADLTEALKDIDLPVVVYGDSSWFHVAIGMDRPPANATEAKTALSTWMPLADRHLLHHGVDTLRLGGFVGVAHTDDEISDTVDAYRIALSKLLRDLEGAADS
jgi:glutamate-1-semialdehyde 2,1-aminomutase